MPRWSRRAAEHLAERYPSVSRTVRRNLPTSHTHAAVAIGTVGVVVAGASADGARTNGRSRLFQTILVGFGWHAGAHVAQAVAYRGYTPGVATAPTLVAPYSIWAWRRLPAAGAIHEHETANPAPLLLLPLLAGGAHALARVLTRYVRTARDGVPNGYA